jgi:hypothetical protein
MLFWVLALPFVLLTLIIGGGLAPPGIGAIAIASVVAFLIVHYEKRRRGSADLL